MMYPNDFVDPWTIPLAPPAGQIFHFFSEKYQYLMDGWIVFIIINKENVIIRYTFKQDILLCSFTLVSC